MSKNVVIVESPAKAKAIERYLGPDFKVLASYGHVRDLVPKNGAVDPDNDFSMKYQVEPKSKKHVDAIRKAVSKADALYLATDPDREGEAIAWHVVQLLTDEGLLIDKPVHRVAFHEITKRAVTEAIQSPRDISAELVDAQQARRALDYLVGFNLSPLLWKKISKGLSAGRVQSPALRMIVEREKERDAFEIREYWSVDAIVEKADKAVKAKLTHLEGKKVEQFDFGDESAATNVRRALLDAASGALRVKNVEKKQRRRNPAPPFTTSTMQQEAVRKLGFSSSRAMRVAQQLYEGIDLGSGPVGLISYMRTDSVNLADEALDEIRGYIENKYGKDNVPKTPRKFKTKAKNAQEAHEAIRPTSVIREPGHLASKLTRDQLRLYQLIWKRTVACQMIHATLDTVAVDFECGDKAIFRATGSHIRTPGFLAVYREGVDDKPEEDDEKDLPALEKDEQLGLRDIETEQHFTEPPPRFTEATLVKVLEEYGIGRPSTYATIISTLLQREYVELDQKRFKPTSTGRIVAKFLSNHFERYVDYDFTARLEDELDEIARGEKAWRPTLEEFWRPFFQQVRGTEKNVSRDDVAPPRELGVDPKSGRQVTVRLGRFGAYVQIAPEISGAKPRSASLRPGQDIDTITLEEALELLELPRHLGKTEKGEDVIVNIGRYGPFVKVGATNISLREEDPMSLTLERACELRDEKNQAAQKRIIKEFADSDIQVLSGRYGPYVTNGTKNARIPKDTEPASLELEQCKELIEKAPARGRGRGRRK